MRKVQGVIRLITIKNISCLHNAFPEVMAKSPVVRYPGVQL